MLTLRQTLNGLFVENRGSKIGSRGIFVKHTGSADAGAGESPDNPITTIQGAINKTTSDSGFTIHVLEGHAETGASAGFASLNRAGVDIIGYGSGDSKPTITLATSTAATFAVSAKNCVIDGLRFVAGIDSLVKMVDLAAGSDRTTMRNCEFKGDSSFQWLSAVNAANGVDYLTFEDLYLEQTTDPGGTDTGDNTGAFYLLGNDHVVIRRCHGWGNIETAFIHTKTNTSLNLRVIDSSCIQLLSGARHFRLATTTTGFDSNGRYVNPNVTDVTESTLIGTEAAGFHYFGSLFGNDGSGGQGGIGATVAS